MLTGKYYTLLIALLGIVFAAGPIYAQDTKGLSIAPDPTQEPEGKTYALIVGISHYQYPCYPTLHYADVDARDFFRYLTSNTGGKIDPANVDTLFNDQATQENIWNKFNSIRIRLQKNDNFYIYFSGHGDAISTDLAYLLAYNAPPGNDRNNYYASGGVVDIHTLKGLIRMITLDKNKPAHVILITDACRSNELPPGKEEGRQQFYEEMYTKNAGEIQLVSCQANQVSFEDAKWGGGRGLFSWHLVNGLMGMADNKPEDGVVTLKELIDYISDNVEADSYDPVTKKARQKPDYCCRDKDDVVLAHVDKPSKDRLALQLKMGKSTSGDYVAYAGKGINLGAEMKNEGYTALYDQFVSAINDDRLIEPANNNAMYFLDQLLEKNIKPELKSDLKFTLSSNLMSDVTKVINTYLHASTNNNNYTYDYFMTAARKLRAFITIGDTLYYNPLDIRVNLLFLEGHAKWHSTNTYDLKESLLKVDSAVALKPQAAYLYNLKGLMHLLLKQYKEAEATYRRGIALAPNWLYPYHNLAQTFTREGKYDSALKYYFKALEIDSNYQTTYEGISGYYSQQGKYDSALYYNAIGIKKDPQDPHLWQDRGYFYYWQKDWQNALNSFYTSISIDSTLYNTYEGVLLVHLDHYTSTDSLRYYKEKMIKSDPDNPSVYRELGMIFHKYALDTLALEMYERSVGIDSMNSETWVAAAESYKQIKDYKNAEGCLFMALKIDSAASNDNIYNELGNLYYSIGENTKSLAAFAYAIKGNPQNAVYDYNYAYVSVANNDPVTAEKYYRSAIVKNPSYALAYFELAKLLSAKSETEALRMLDKAITYGTFDAAEIENEKAFVNLKNNSDFKKLLKKMKE